MSENKFARRIRLLFRVADRIEKHFTRSGSMEQRLDALDEVKELREIANLYTEMFNK